MRSPSFAWSVEHRAELCAKTWDPRILSGVFFLEDFVRVTQGGFSERGNSHGLLLFSTNLLGFYHECRSLIGYATTCIYSVTDSE